MLRIREARKARNITQMALAEMVGVAQASVCEWESGKSAPKMESFVKIGRALNCSLDYLAGLSDKDILPEKAG